MSAHNLPPALVKTLDATPAYEISRYLSERTHREHLNRTWNDHHNQKLILDLIDYIERIKDAYTDMSTEEGKVTL